MLALAVGGVAAPWLGRSGKILILIAGLAVLLDLIGPDRMKKWSQSAGYKRRTLTKRIEHLKTAKRLESLLADMAMHVALKRYDLKSDYFSTGELAQAGACARETYLKSQPFYRAIPPDPHFIAESRAVKEAVRQLLLRSSKLTEGEREALDEFQAEFLRHERRSDPWINALFALAAIPGTFIMYRSMAPLGHSPFMTFLLAFSMATALAMLVVLALLSPRVVLEGKWATATVRFGLAHVALKLIGQDKSGRPMRWAALTAFITGSLLDLLASW